MEAQSNTPSQDKGRLVALQGNLKDLPLEDVLRQVYNHLLSENEHKREQIEELKADLQKLVLKVETEKDELQQLLKEETRKQEGAKQLINKLLEDIRRYQNDIEWYKRTYETRSFLGTMKEKIFNRLG